MAESNKQGIWKGEEAFKYLEDVFFFPKKVDALVICAPGDHETGLQVAETLQKLWVQAVSKKEAPALFGGHLRDADINSDEGFDEVDGGSKNSKPLFPRDPTDCETCSKTIPKMKIAVLDAGYLFLDEFLEELHRMMSCRKALLVPVLTKKFLSQPEFLIRTYYLKLAVRNCEEHVLPVIPAPWKVPNFLFEHLMCMKMYRTDKWGRDEQGMYTFSEERVKWRLISFLLKKISKRGRECPHPPIRKDLPPIHPKETATDMPHESDINEFDGQ